jgi:hypothetical protein
MIKIMVIQLGEYRCLSLLAALSHYQTGTQAVFHAAPESGTSIYRSFVDCDSGTE